MRRIIFLALIVITLSNLPVCSAFAGQDKGTVIKELSKYPDNVKGSNDDDYLDNKKFIAKYGSDTAKQMADIAGGYINAMYSTDYRKIDQADFTKRLRYYFMPESGQSWFIWTENKWFDVNSTIQKQYDEVKKYKLIRNASLTTDSSLVYSTIGGFRVRGRFRMFFDKAEGSYLKEFERQMIIWTFGQKGWKAQKNTSNSLTKGKWYYSDVEIRLGDLFSKNPDLWTHSRYTFCELIYLSNWRKEK